MRETLRLNGADLSFVTAGAGRPTLFLHGADGIADPPPLLARLAESRRLIIPDHPGFGESPPHPLVESVSDLSYFYLDVLERLSLRDVHLIGHFLGGWIALEMAVRSCERISGLTLIASGGLSLPQAPQADLFLHNPEDTARMMYFDPGLAAAAADRAAQEKNVETAIRNRVASATYGWNPRFCNPHLGKWLHRAQAPALVLWGARDEIVPVATAHEFGRLLPNAQVSILENCGHLPHVEQPEASLAAIEAFHSSAGRATA